MEIVRKACTNFTLLERITSLSIKSKINSTMEAITEFIIGPKWPRGMDIQDHDMIEDCTNNRVVNSIQIQALLSGERHIRPLKLPMSSYV